MGLNNTIVAKYAGLISTITPKSNSSIVLNGGKLPQVLTTFNFGIRGPRGADGSTFIYKTAAQVISGHRVMRSNNVGEVENASSQNVLHGDDTLGLSLNSANVGGQVQVAISGQFVIFSGWNFVAGRPIFLSENGMLSQLEPLQENGDFFHQEIGYAETPTSLFIKISEPIYF